MRFPHEFKLNGKTFLYTGKEGVNRDTGLTERQYQSLRDWIYVEENGNVYKDDSRNARVVGKVSLRGKGFPYEIKFKGREYVQDGQPGTSFDTGNLIQDYHTLSDYVWLKPDGRVVNDGPGYRDIGKIKMSSLEEDLIKLGSNHPELQEDIRPVLAKLEPIKHFRGRPVYEEVILEDKDIVSAQKKGFDKCRKEVERELLREGGKLHGYLQKIVGMELADGSFTSEADREAQLDEYEDQSFGYLPTEFPVLTGDEGMRNGEVRSAFKKVDNILDKTLSDKGSYTVQCDGVYYKDGMLSVDVSWWGAMWGSDWS